LRLALLQQSRAALQAHTHTTDIARVTLEDAMVLFHAIGDDAHGYAAFSLHGQIEVDLGARDVGVWKWRISVARMLIVLSAWRRG